MKGGPFSCSRRVSQKDLRQPRTGTNNDCSLGNLNRQIERRKQNVAVAEFTLEVNTKVEKICICLGIIREKGLNKLDGFVSVLPSFPIEQSDRKLGNGWYVFRIHSGFPDNFCKLHHKLAPPYGLFTIN